MRGKIKSDASAMKFVLKLLGGLLSLSLSFHNCEAQCRSEGLTLNTVNPLASASLVAGTSSQPPVIHVRRLNIVCLATNTIYGTYRSASVVLEYTCSGKRCPKGIL